MRKIKLDSKLGKNIVNELKAEPFSLFIGSAISGWEPTSILTGGALTSYLFEILFPSNMFIEFPKTKKFLREYFDKVPFENLFELCPNQNLIKLIFREEFSIERFNVMHHNIAKAFINEEIKNILTTNYDLCLDKLLGFCPGFSKSNQYPNIQRIISQDDYKTKSKDISGVYFKIHGTADDVTGNTMIYSLSQENLMPQWKQKFLQKILTNQTILIVGYSGRDFEICPEIMKIKNLKIYYNQRSERGLTYNARRILRRKQAVLLEGDMVELFRNLFALKKRPIWGKSNMGIIMKISERLSSEEITIWRIKLLNNIGIPILCRDDINQLLLPSNKKICLTPFQIQIEHEVAQTYFHLGKYKQSSKFFFKAGLTAKKLGENLIWIENLLDVVSVYLTSGHNLRALFLLNHIKKELEKVNKDKSVIRLLGEYLLRVSRAYAKVYRFSMIRKIKLFNSVYQSKMEDLLQKTLTYALESGHWFEYQQVRLLSDRVGININKLAKGRYYSPPPVKTGYENLGYYIPQSISFRDKIVNKGKKLSDKDFKRLSYLIQQGKFTGNYPEVWKLFWLGIRLSDKWRFDKTKYLELWNTFTLCEYALITSIGYKLLFIMFFLKSKIDQIRG